MNLILFACNAQQSHGLIWNAVCNHFSIQMKLNLFCDTKDSDNKSRDISKINWFIRIKARLQMGTSISKIAQKMKLKIVTSSQLDLFFKYFIDCCFLMEKREIRLTIIARIMFWCINVHKYYMILGNLWKIFIFLFVLFVVRFTLDNKPNLWMSRCIDWVDN